MPAVFESLLPANPLLELTPYTAQNARCRPSPSAAPDGRLRSVSAVTPSCWHPGGGATIRGIRESATGPVDLLHRYLRAVCPTPMSVADA